MTLKQTGQLNAIKASILDLIYTQQAHQNEIQRLEEIHRQKRIEIAEFQKECERGATSAEAKKTPKR